MGRAKNYILILIYIYNKTYFSAIRAFFKLCLKVVSEISDKAFDCVPREAIWLALRHQGLSIALVMAKGQDSSRCFWWVWDRSGSTSRISTEPFVMVMHEATREARCEGLWDLYADGLAIRAEWEEDAVKKFGVWKRVMETRGLKVNMNKTKLMVMGREPAVGS